MVSTLGVLANLSYVLVASYGREVRIPLHNETTAGLSHREVIAEENTVQLNGHLSY